MIFTLLLILSVILCVDITLFTGNLCSPAVMFTAGFWFSTLFSWLYQDHWNGFGNTALLMLVTIGIVSFSLGCLAMKYFLGSKKYTGKSIDLYPINIPKYKIYIYLMLEIIITILIIYVVLMNASSNNIIIASGQYYHAAKYHQLVYEPRYSSVLQYFNMAGVLITSYVAINNLICRKRNLIILYVVIVFGMGISLLQGVRNTFFAFIISDIVMFYLLRGAKRGWKSDFDIKILLKGILFVALLIVLFQATTVATGRTTSEFTFMEMLSTYIGAPLKNLELFLLEPHAKSKVFGGQTLLQTYGKLYVATGNEIFKIENLYTYRWIGTKGLGNVYTILMPLYQDFGYFGTAMVLFIIGALSEWMFHRVKMIKHLFGISYDIIIYAYCAFSISFSFFSNKYFEMVFSVSFIYLLISLVLIKLFFANIRYGHGKLVLYRKDHL